MVKTSEQQVCEQATGCTRAGDYRRWAEQQGYPFCEVFDWTSSAGDWSFIVSQDGTLWFPMIQENAYPKPGFRRSIDENQPIIGTAEEALQILSEMCG